MNRQRSEREGMNEPVEKPKPILDYKDLKDPRDIIKLERAPILQFGVHRSACSSYGDEAPSRLCQMIVDSNKAFLQEVINNKIDLLDTMDDKDLLEADDLGEYDYICSMITTASHRFISYHISTGISLPFLAVYFDRPDILKYLHSRGVDLSKPCDPMNYGNIMFYAVCMKVNLYTILSTVYPFHFER